MMNELYALTTWNSMPYSQRAALLAGITGHELWDRGHIVTKSWAQLDSETQAELMRLDWNFMLGGKLKVK